MHVLLAIKGFGVGGAERLVLLKSRWLLSQHVRVTVANLDPRVQALRSEFLSAGARVEDIEALSWRAPAALFRLVQLIRRENVTLLHAHLPIAGCFACVAAAVTGRPIVYTEHSIVGRYKLITRLLNRVAYRFYDAVVAVSDAVRLSVQNSYGLRASSAVQVIRNPVLLSGTTPRATRSTKRVALNVTGDYLVVGTIANFRKVKRLDRLLRAFAALYADEPNLVLVLIGDGPEDKRLRTLAHVLGVEDRVRFVGHRADAAECSSAIDIFVVCSDWEGLPFALLDAMASGCAVVATAVGGIPELVQHGTSGLLVADDSELIAAIRLLGRNPKMRSLLGERASQSVRTRHDLSSIMTTYLDVYSKCLDSKTAVTNG